ncbi:hypothetical protein [Cupriavidus sp. RAF12]|uniref:hypothetical protein n=1 Tax=Cupriavidus sp. RAF12 TaxID=3233050 RepID=UPI003F8EFDA8
MAEEAGVLALECGNDAPPDVQGMEGVPRKAPAADIVPVLSWLAGGIALAAAVIGGAISARRRLSG